MQINYSKKSLHDLENIFHYIANSSPNNAINYLSKVKEKIELIASFPNIGIDCKNKGINEECQIYIFDSYLIFYTKQTNAIIINRIIHHGINYQELL
jgi:plasmid stabilization system protein ParE